MYFGARVLLGDAARADLTAALDWPLAREDLGIIEMPFYVDEKGLFIPIDTCREWHGAVRRKLKIRGAGNWMTHLELAVQCDPLRVLSGARAPERSMVSRDKFTSDVFNLPISVMPTDNSKLCDHRQRQAERGFTLADLGKEGKYKRQILGSDGVRIVRGARIAYFALAAIADVDGDGWAEYVITQYHGYTGKRNYLVISTLWLSKTDKGFVAGPIPPDCRETIGKP
ncbi:MAG: hypothetical protein EXQ92_13555 [Alphaproteobacteria bacterium]|nr:hypothetical protein [Alphaproteobacteria bacterium]